ncbi:hypothetical protein BKI52_17005 [marine bacterium AO1-C]|nr:hypothetical protein BKI52_17005 [marine bacterium AO1-C]
MVGIKRLQISDLELARKLIHLFQTEEDMGPPTYASKERLLELLSDSSFYMIAAFQDGTLVGGLTAYVLRMYKDDIAKILLYEIEVQQDWRRQGLGTLLINRLKEYARQEGASKILIPVTSTNQNAINFYNSLQNNITTDDILISVSIA